MDGYSPLVLRPSHLPHQVSQLLHHLMPNGEVDDEPEDVVEGSNEWTGGQCRVDFEAVQCHGNPRAKEAGEDDDKEERDARRNAQREIHVKKHTHAKYNSRAYETIDEPNAQFLPQFLP